MKQGTYGTLETLAKEITRQNEVKKDYIVNSSTMTISTGTLGSTMTVNYSDVTNVSDNAVNQLGVRLGIPNSYLNTLKEQSSYLLDENINHWLHTKEKNLMVRNLDNISRAFLSDRYKRLDNYPIMDMAMSAIMDTGNKDIEVASCDVTDTRMFMKFKSPKLEGEISVGDPVQMGLIISNSEVGYGALEIKALIYRLVCDNGMVVPKNYGESIRRTHLGAKQDMGVLYAEDTIMLEGQAMASKIRDTINQLLSPEEFKKHLQAFKETQKRVIEGSVPEAVKELGRIVGFNQNEGEGIMRHLVSGGQLNQFGLLNAVTAYSQDDVVNYNRASQLEEIGGKILTLTPRQWNTISQAA